MNSVLQNWVLETCTLRMQGVLILALRGPDGVRKEDAAKPIVRTLRAIVMNSGRLGVPMENGEFFVGDRFMTMQFISYDTAWAEVCKEFMDQWDAYNVHFLQHLMHAYAVIGLNYPNFDISTRAWEFYKGCCNKIHVIAETREQINSRLRDGIRLEHDE